MSGGSKLSIYHNEPYYNIMNPSPMDLQKVQHNFLNYFNNRNATLPIQQKRNSIVAKVNNEKIWNFTWLIFLKEKWVPFDLANQSKLEQTLTVGGTFVDITDSHFPEVKRVRVFPKNNYLSYLGLKYRLSRIMQPDAYLDHVSVAEAKKTTSLNSY